MIIEKGNRRVAVITEGLITLIAISVVALFVPAHAVGVLTVTGGAVGVLMSFYFHADGKVKEATASKK